MKIEKLDSTHLRNEEHFQFHFEFKHLMEKFEPSEFDIGNEFSKYREYFQMEETAIEPIKKSAITDNLIRFGKERNSIFRGLNYMVKASMHHYDGSIKKVAERLSVVLKHYGNIAAKPNNERTASITNLISDLRNSYAEDVEKAGISHWVYALEEQNQAFETLMRERFSDDAKKSTLKMKEVRVQIDKQYSSIIEKINALTIINGSGTYAEFVRELNTRIEKYQILLAQRKGRNKKKAGK